MYRTLTEAAGLVAKWLIPKTLAANNWNNLKGKQKYYPNNPES